MQPKPALDICKTDSLPTQLAIGNRLQARTIISDGNLHLARILLDIDLQLATGDHLRQTMLESIFDYRLQKHGWYEGFVQSGSNIHCLFYPAGIAQILHRQVSFDEIHLITQRNQLRVTALNSDTHEKAKLFQHPICSFNVNPHEAGDSVHGVE